MNAFSTYQLYEIERLKSPAERRAAEARLGEIAASLTRRPQRRRLWGTAGGLTAALAAPRRRAVRRVLQAH